MKVLYLLLPLVLILSWCTQEKEIRYVQQECPKIQENCGVYFDSYGWVTMDGKWYIVKRIWWEPHLLTWWEDKFLFCKQLECTKERELYYMLKCK